MLYPEINNTKVLTSKYLKDIVVRIPGYQQYLEISYGQGQIKNSDN